MRNDSSNSRAFRIECCHSTASQTYDRCHYFSSLIKLLQDEVRRVLGKRSSIVTGIIEGACRHVIKDRMERSGMRRKDKGAQSMLNLRCIEASELWDLVTEQHRVVSLSKFGKHRKNYCDDSLTMAPNNPNSQSHPSALQVN